MRFTTATTAGLILASTAAAAATPRPEPFQSIEEVEAAGAGAPVEARSGIQDIAQHAAEAGRLGKDPSHNHNNKINGANGGAGAGAGDLGAQAAGQKTKTKEGRSAEDEQEQEEDDEEEEKDIEIVESRDTERITLWKTKMMLGSLGGATEAIWRENHEEKTRRRRDADSVDEGGAFGGPNRWACRMM